MITAEDREGKMDLKMMSIFLTMVRDAHYGIDNNVVYPQCTRAAQQ